MTYKDDARWDQFVDFAFGDWCKAEGYNDPDEELFEYFYESQKENLEEDFLAEYGQTLEYERLRLNNEKLEEENEELKYEVEELKQRLKDDAQVHFNTYKLIQQSVHQLRLDAGDIVNFCAGKAVNENHRIESYNDNCYLN
jgi:DNA anti-recombination protein RmuC